MSNPFVAPGQQAILYGSTTRLASRTGALSRAKTAGLYVPRVIVQLVRQYAAEPEQRVGVVADIGCGRGTSSRFLAEHLRPRTLIGIDASPAMVAEARSRTGRWPGTRTAFIQGDFNYLPLPDAGCDLVVAAFCLYHSRTPDDVVREIARVLAPGGLAVLVTKGVDSYRELDALIALPGLDPGAVQRESLYTAAHSGNLADLTRPWLEVQTVVHDEHRFVFSGLNHAAEYLATSPKYELPAGLYGSPQALAAVLHEWLHDQPVTTSSTVTYVVAQSKRSRT
ncbi:class I SAM-dependent methyltransferase [Streptomyces sp. TS71-3]|uniref:class I SAM-dependent methyltransferase n=1 Tax=Streptomyces sp. TS71-3 TaxID=2733862 RepID=UPI001B0797C0|nr:class I SAM-dependent methyltransferase [Streptomyces sp. TS71-3]GHJ35423.1 hypothetical protein Sm713_10320 [Streptomyces sp. TS71-3]